MLVMVQAVGNGTRGAVFAAYAFSEHVLGVSPWYRAPAGLHALLASSER